MSSGLPIIADADTGFGEGEMCARTVRKIHIKIHKFLNKYTLFLNNILKEINFLL
jgi:hypothetical protein